MASDALVPRVVRRHVLSRLLNHEALSSRMIERIVGEAPPPPWLDGERR